MSKFNLDLGKFKKVKSDKETTTLRHSDGHEIKLAHKLLSPKMKEQLHALPMADGGEVEQPKKKDSGPYMDPEAAKKVEKGATEGDYDPKVWIKNLKEGLGLAKGGKVEAERIPASDESLDVEEIKEKPLEYEKFEPLDTKEVKPKKMADGGPAQDPIPQPNASTEETAKTDAPPQDQPAAPAQAPVVINVGSPAPAPQQPAPSAITPEMMDAALKNVASANNQRPDLAKQVNGAPSLMPAQAPQAAPTGPSLAPQAMQQTPNDPFGTEAHYKALQQGLGQQIGGIQQEAQALGQQGKAESAALQQDIENKQQNQLDYQSHLRDLEGERQHFISDVESQHIDPNHYMNSLNTGERVMKGIGLILGGIGGGLTHSENPALQMIQMQINNDIDAQKANLGKTQNLLSANLHQFGNLRDATEMTRVMQNDLVVANLKKAAANAADPLAKARANQAIGKLLTDNSAALGQIAMRRTILNGGAAGRIPPEQVIRAIVPPGEQKGYYDELKEAQNTVGARDNMLGAFDKISELNTVWNNFKSPRSTSSQINALVDPLIASLSKETAGRFSKEDASYIRTLFPTALDTKQDITVKRNRLNEIISEKMHFPQLQSIGINPTTMGRFGAGADASKKIQLGPVK